MFGHSFLLRLRPVRALAAAALLGCFAASAPGAEAVYSFPPAMRPLPVAADRPVAAGPSFYVDAAKGSDQGPGTETAPLKTIAAALPRLKPGDTLYIRGGTYYESLLLACAGTAEKPITIRAYPRELVIIDSGLREFTEHAESAWIPSPSGVEGEFWSAKTYEPEGKTLAMGVPAGVNVLGRFAETMVPLHGYWKIEDLRSTNELWVFNNKIGQPDSIYCGPGIAYDPLSKRIHIRLAHTSIEGHPENYRGETDPRKLKLSISRPGVGSTLTLEECQNIRIQDLVFRGARGPTIRVSASQDIVLEGVTSYGGYTCVQLEGSQRFRATRCAFRGLAAPWSFRSSLKYRSIESQLFSASAWQTSDNSDLEVEHSDLTDSVDGIFIGSVRNMKFHHNFVENISDDGIFVTAGTDYEGNTTGGNLHIYQNYIARTMTAFSFGAGHGRQKVLAGGRQTGAGVWIYRNVFDFRQWVPYFPHRNAGETPFDPIGKSTGDHGSPVWEPMWVYHNTIIAGKASFRDGYVNGFGYMAIEKPRRVFNNICIQVSGLPGMVLADPKADLEADGNLHWSLKDGPGFSGDFFAKYRSSRSYPEIAKRSSPWAKNDVFGDPKLEQLTPEPVTSIDPRPQVGSPAIDGGVAIPAEWPDPLRSADESKPDIGALPRGAARWTVGASDLPVGDRK